MVPESYFCRFSAGVKLVDIPHWLAYCEIGAQNTKRWIISTEGLVVEDSQED